MRFVVSLCCLILVNVLFGQSKKEMIAILNNKVYSLNQVVMSEHFDIQMLNSEISLLKRQFSDLDSTKDELTQTLKP